MLVKIQALLLTTTVFACMADSQCKPTTECCYMNSCYIATTDECMGNRLNAYQWAKTNIKKPSDVKLVSKNRKVASCQDPNGFGCPDILKSIYDSGMTQSALQSQQLLFSQVSESEHAEKQNSY